MKATLIILKYIIKIMIGKSKLHKALQLQMYLNILLIYKDRQLMY